MKSDEREFLVAVANRQPGEHVRNVIANMDIHYKRCWYLLDKWSSKGWYEWGVTMDLGWLTEEGKQKAREIANA